MSNCNQCEQTARGVCCPITPETHGVCGKNEDVQSLQETLIYGLKGMSAYASHARRLGASDPEVDAFVQEALFLTMTNVNFDVPTTLEYVLECGRMNLKVMKMLDEAHVTVMGKPAPAEVKEGTQAGPGILVTGHDLLDLKRLLAACEGTAVKVYTHGEMLPAHMYPTLHNHPNLAGHYGGAWQKQLREFDAFPGAILATTNCIQIPKESYKDRFFTTRNVAAPGTTRIKDDSYRAVVDKALALPPCKEEIRGNEHGRLPPLGRPRAGGRDRRRRKGRQGQPLLPHRRVRWRRAGPQLLQRLRRRVSRATPSSSRSAAASTVSATTRTERSSACPGSSTWDSATTPTAPSWSPRSWPRRSSAPSTICR